MNMKPIYPFVQFRGFNYKNGAAIKAAFASFPPVKDKIVFFPFLADAQVLFFLLVTAAYLGDEPSFFFLSDGNFEVFNTFNIIRTNPDELIRALKNHAWSHSREYYYQQRDMCKGNDMLYHMPQVDRAARFMYLCAACKDGMYSMDRNRDCNAVFGEEGHNHLNFIKDTYNIHSLHYYLNLHRIRLQAQYYGDACAEADNASFVFLNPPARRRNYFKKGFGQSMLNVCNGLNARGAHFLLSMPVHPDAQELFCDYSFIAIDSDDKHKELLIKNY
jgi:DNA adenine methylase